MPRRRGARALACAVGLGVGLEAGCGERSPPAQWPRPELPSLAEPLPPSEPEAAPDERQRPGGAPGVPAEPEAAERAPTEAATRPDEASADAPVSSSPPARPTEAIPADVAPPPAVSEPGVVVGLVNLRPG